MNFTYARSPEAGDALRLVSQLQERFRSKLSLLPGQPSFSEQNWLRDDGRHGGGSRFFASDQAVFNRASINVSQVHYDDETTKALGSATALSTIIHPINVFAPSVHIHISWTEMRDGKSYWRVMADLNPAIAHPVDTEKFKSALIAAAGNDTTSAFAQGDKYFYIPVLQRHRGVTHYYLENYATESPEEDSALARRIGEAAIDHYVEILEGHLANPQKSDEAGHQQQLDYHTLYFFQVLTLDRGTTSGLLIHDQNDLGILASLPSHINKALLKSWQPLMPKPQDELLGAILSLFPDEAVCEVNDDIKLKICAAMRQHYGAHPEALSLQASATVVPSTVANHQNK